MGFFDEIMSEETYLDDKKIGEVLREIVVVENDEIYFDSSNGYGVFNVKKAKRKAGKDLGYYSFNISGNFGNKLVKGQTYEIKGRVSKYKNEKQLKIIDGGCHNIKPINKKGIISYLKTLNGLKTRAYDIYDEFGDKSIDVLIENPMKVANSIRGIGKKSVNKWKKELDKMEESRGTLLTLYQYGLSPKDVHKLLEKYGASLIPQIEKNPYFLAKESRSFNFKKCDTIAKEMGYDMTSNFRVQEGIIYTLNHISIFGHVYTVKDTLHKKTKELLDIPEDKIFITTEKFNENIEILELSSKIVVIENHIYLKELYDAEKTIARKVEELSIEKDFADSWNLEEELNQYLEENNIELADKQYEAVMTIASKKGGFYVLTGNAGSGKTFVLKIVLEMIKKRYRDTNDYLVHGLCAPTGKASKVASKATGMPCKTIHRLLSFNPGTGGFLHNEENLLDENVLAIDEGSMINVLLGASLFRALRFGTKVILMGDVKQLPAIGAGNMLNDLIEASKQDSNNIKVIELDVPQRQKDDSGIINNANRVIELKNLVNSKKTGDFFVSFQKKDNKSLKIAVASIKKLIETRNYTLEDIQIISPQKSGVAGVYNANFVMQSLFNKSDAQEVVLNRTFNCEGQQKQLYFKKNDKVIHTDNNYEVQWYEKNPYGEYKEKGGVEPIITNGETGVIEDIQKIKVDGITTKKIIVKYDDGYMFYIGDYSSLDHAYALTIHKSQGSEWKVVIVMIPQYMHPNLAVNNIIYTAITRAKEIGFVIGAMRMIEQIIQNLTPLERNTSLQSFINKDSKWIYTSN